MFHKEDKMEIELKISTNEAQLIIDALDILDPDTDRADIARIELVERIRDQQDEENERQMVMDYVAEGLGEIA